MNTTTNTIAGQTVHFTLIEDLLKMRRVTQNPNYPMNAEGVRLIETEVGEVCRRRLVRDPAVVAAAVAYVVTGGRV